MVRTIISFPFLHVAEATVDTLNKCVCFWEYSYNEGFIVKVTSILEFPLLLGGVAGDVVCRHELAGQLNCDKCLIDGEAANRVHETALGGL